eukprot:979736-Rhodomonas_salina.3
MLQYEDNAPTRTSRTSPRSRARPEVYYNWILGHAHAPKCTLDTRSRARPEVYWHRSRADPDVYYRQTDRQPDTQTHTQAARHTDTDTHTDTHTDTDLDRQTDRQTQLIDTRFENSPAQQLSTHTTRSLSHNSTPNAQRTTLAPRQNYFRVGERVLAHGRDPYFDGWEDTAQLNYGHGELRSEMCKTLAKIATMCDGVRCDMAMLQCPVSVAS